MDKVTVQIKYYDKLKQKTVKAANIIEGIKRVIRSEHEFLNDSNHYINIKKKGETYLVKVFRNKGTEPVWRSCNISIPKYWFSSEVKAYKVI